MSAIYRRGSVTYFDDMTPAARRFMSEATRQVMPGWDLGSIVLADDVDDQAAPVASILKIAPNDVLPRHAHDCHRVEIILEGSLATGSGEVLTPGDIMVSRRGEFYGPHTAGPDGCLSVEIFSAQRGTAPIAPAGGADDAHATDVADRVTAILERR